MGRRALRKIDPALDLSGAYLEAEDLPPRFEARSLFGREAPLQVDVGCGKGMFLFGASIQRPDHNFLGVELARKYARFTAARLARHGRENARVIHADAKWLFHIWFPSACLTAVHIYFPDPWWKKRHKKRRVMSEGFLQDVERVLLPGGELHFWTDVEEYFQTGMEAVREYTELSGPFAVEEPVSTGDLDFRTHFERRSRQQHLAVYRALFRKADEEQTTA